MVALLARASTEKNSKPPSVATSAPAAAPTTAEAVLARMNEKLESYFASGCKGSPPDCPDYVGPVTIDRVPGMGRGLFLTEPVKAGDLLLCCNALAVARVVHTVRGRPRPATIMSAILSPVCQELSTKLLDKARTDASVSEQISVLQGVLSGPEVGPIPPMSIFPGGATFSKALVRRGARGRVKARPVNMVDLVGVLPRNAISTQGGGPGLATFGYKLNHKTMGGYSRPDHFYADDKADVGGLWGLPSLINHSCCPNASWRHVGEAMFINASRDMEAGTEIRIAVHDVLPTRWTTLSAPALAASWSATFPTRCPATQRSYPNWPPTSTRSTGAPRADLATTRCRRATWPCTCGIWRCCPSRWSRCWRSMATAPACGQRCTRTGSECPSRKLTCRGRCTP